MQTARSIGVVFFLVAMRRGDYKPPCIFATKILASTLYKSACRVETVQTTYAKRLRQAIEHAGMSQAELARRIGLKSGPQAVQYLADDKNNSRGSRHTAAFAQAL